MTKDPYKYFRIEAAELLDQLGKCTLDLEKGQPPLDLMQRLLRLAHTLKGAARVVKLVEIANLAHAIEDCLAPYRDGTTGVPSERINAVLKLLDTISTHMTAIGKEAEPVEAGVAPRPLSELPLHTRHANVGEMDAILSGVTDVHVQVAALRRGIGPLGDLLHLTDLLVEQLSAPRIQSSLNGTAAKIVPLAEELHHRVAILGETVRSGMDQIDKELRQVREATERLRLEPAGLIFNSLERTARDTALSLGKHVTFQSEGGHVRLDGHVLSIIQSALVQVVRNAVAHGIEREADRLERGKPTVGRVTVTVARRGNRVSFSCTDDGGGIDLEAVRGIAIRKGLREEEARKLGTDELVQILFRGGISTSGSVTEVSGRGIGLDIVREAAVSLGGDVKVRTDAPKGSTFELSVPVKMSSLDVLVVEVAGQAVAIPVESVRRTLRLHAADIVRSPDGDAIGFDENVIPFCPLFRFWQGWAPTVSVPMIWTTVVLESRGAMVALGVDRLLGTETLILRPLPDLTPADTIVAGASLDSEGNPRLVLDVDGLIEGARLVETSDPLASRSRPSILIIDDSLTTRMLEQSILQSAGYDVSLAASAEEAIDMAHRHRYALFLVDVDMPGMGGFGFLDHARHDAALVGVPSIMVTSGNTREDRHRSEALGAVGYIVKSEFNQVDFLKQIRNLAG